MIPAPHLSTVLQHYLHHRHVTKSDGSPPPWPTLSACTAASLTAGRASRRGYQMASMKDCTTCTHQSCIMSGHSLTAMGGPVWSTHSKSAYRHSPEAACTACAPLYAQQLSPYQVTFSRNLCTPGGNLGVNNLPISHPCYVAAYGTQANTTPSMSPCTPGRRSRHTGTV
jgi:hypothetical protein